MLFPNGIYSNAEKHRYLTREINQYFQLIISLSKILKENKKRNSQKSIENSLSVAGSGVEPETFGLWIQRSNHLSYPAVFFIYPFRSLAGSGVEVWVHQLADMNPTLSILRPVNNGVQKYKKLAFREILLALMTQLFERIWPHRQFFVKKWLAGPSNGPQ